MPCKSWFTWDAQLLTVLLQRMLSDGLMADGWTSYMPLPSKPSQNNRIPWHWFCPGKFETHMISYVG